MTRPHRALGRSAPLALFLLLVAAGYENDDIARQINLPMTQMVETLANAMDKLGAKDRHAAALKAKLREIRRVIAEAPAEADRGA